MTQPEETQPTLVGSAGPAEKTVASKKRLQLNKIVTSAVALNKRGASTKTIMTTLMASVNLKKQKAIAVAEKVLKRLVMKKVLTKNKKGLYQVAKMRKRKSGKRRKS